MCDLSFPASFDDKIQDKYDKEFDISKLWPHNTGEDKSQHIIKNDEYANKELEIPTMRLIH